MTARTPVRGSLGVVRASVALARLRWSLLRGGLRGSSQQRLQTLVAVVVSVLAGLGALVAFSGLGRRSGVGDEIVVVALPFLVLGTGLVAAVTGVEGSLDPTRLAVEPLRPVELGVGVLVGSLVGPGTVVGCLAGVGLLVGWVPSSAVGAVVVTAAVVSWWATLLLVGRCTADLLGLVAAGRFKRAAQMAAAASGIVLWGVTQLVFRTAGTWSARQWERAADVAAWTPPGQLARALGAVDRPGEAAVHLVLGALWLPVLGWAAVAATNRLATGAAFSGEVRRTRTGRGGLRVGPLRHLPHTPAGAVAVRTLRTKFRTPRQAVNTFLALAVGIVPVVLTPLVEVGGLGSRTVLLGALITFTVVFDGNNTFGYDGPALWIEVGSGLRARDLVAGKVIASLVTLAVPVVAVPVVLAALSGGWAWLVAGWVLTAGAVLAGAGVAVLNATLAPVPMPENPNPFAAADTGAGCLSGLMLALGGLVMGVAAVPVVGALLLVGTTSPWRTTAVSLLAPVLGGVVLWGCSRLAELRLEGQEDELVRKVTPSR